MATYRCFFVIDEYEEMIENLYQYIIIQFDVK